MLDWSPVSELPRLWLLLPVVQLHSYAAKFVA